MEELRCIPSIDWGRKGKGAETGIGGSMGGSGSEGSIGVGGEVRVGGACEVTGGDSGTMSSSERCSGAAIEGTGDSSVSIEGSDATAGASETSNVVRSSVIEELKGNEARQYPVDSTLLRRCYHFRQTGMRSRGNWHASIPLNTLSGSEPFHT